MDEFENDDVVKLLPPFYLVGNYAKCWKCEEEIEVYCLACHQVEDDAYDDPAMVTYIEWLPAGLLEEIHRVNERLRLATTKTSGTTYYANHCKCGAVLGDFYLMKPGEAFFPTTDEELQRLWVKKLSADDGFKSRCSPSWGVADRLLDLHKNPE